MTHTTDTGRPGTLAAPSSESGMGAALRGRLVVEIYRPPPRGSLPARRTAHQTRSGALARCVAVVAVLAVHVAAGAWLWFDTAGVLLPRSALRGPLTLVPVQSIPSERITYDEAPSIAFSPKLPALDFPRRAIPQLKVETPPPVELALTVSSAADTLISDASAADAAHLVSACDMRRVWRVVADPAALVTVLVRVERDGHVTDTKIEVGSGVPSVDAAAQRCISASALLTPRRLNGEPVLSWQRVHFSRG